MDKTECNKVIGFDLGHGEFSLAGVSMWPRNQPQIIEINNRKSQITAVGKDGNGKTTIGQNAARRPDVENFEICFKKNPSACTTLDRQNIRDFVVEIYNNLRKEQHIEDIENSAHFFVGCPSGWKDEDKDTYEEWMRNAGLSNVYVVRESRAALMQAKENQKITPSDLAKSVLVVDIGSSTTDFTWVRNEYDTPMDYGANLGASLIDKEIFRRTLDKHVHKEQLEEYFQQHPHLRNRCEFACRDNKEAYFEGPECYESEYVNAKFEDIQRKYVFSPQVNRPIMEEILNQPMAPLRNKSWKSAFRDSLKNVNQKLNAEGITPIKILLTGGASRMNFIAEICREVFPKSLCVIDNEPELAIAMGLAHWGRIDINTRKFSHEANNTLKRELESIVERQIETLINSQAEELASGAVNEVLRPKLSEWSRGEIATSKELETKVQLGGEEWFRGSEASTRMTSKLKDWLQTVNQEVEEKLAPLYDKYGLNETALGITTFNLKPDIEQFSNSIFIKEAITHVETYTYTEGTATGAVTGGLGGVAVGVGAAWLFFVPVIPLALGAGVIGSAVGAWIGTEEKTGKRFFEKRELSNSEIEHRVQKQKKLLSQEIQKTLKSNSDLKTELIQKMSEVLEDALKEKIDKARLLI